jgi:hypothetical protein
MYITNEGVGNNITVAEALTTGSDGGNQATLGLLGSGSSGGTAGIGGQGGANMNSAPGAVGDVQLAAQTPAASLTFQGGNAAPQYAG